MVFEYEKDCPVLKDVSFHAKAGESIALVGPTGAGKSTIVNLVSRFYNIKSGAVLIDDFDIAKATLKSIRSQMDFKVAFAISKSSINTAPLLIL